VSTRAPDTIANFERRSANFAYDLIRGLSLAGEVKLSMILYSVLAVASVGITVAIQVGIYYCITKKRAKKAEQSRLGHEPVQMRA